MSPNFGALADMATTTDAPSRMTVIDMKTDQPLIASDGKECFIDLLSTDSDVGRKLDRSRSTAQMRKMRTGRNRRDDDEDLIELQVETLVTLAAGWYFGPNADVFTKDAAKSLFADPAFAWLRRQAFVFVNDAANFLKGSSKNSAASPSKKSEKTAS